MTQIEFDFAATCGTELLPHLLPENANNDNRDIHPYGPFKSYMWDYNPMTDYHDLARYVINLDKPWHVVDKHMTPCFGNLHAHVARDSRDCDSSYENDYVAVAADCDWNNSREVVNLVKTGNLYEHDWNAYQPCTNEAEFRYTMLDLDDWDTDEGSYRFEQVDADGTEYTRCRPTDEGYEAEAVRFCYDWSCDVMARRFRDHTAESMGY